MICTCPAAAAIQDIPVADCPESFGQIQKVAFQRLKDDDGGKTGFTTAAAITLQASWAALMTATDSTKIAISPYIQNPTAEGGAPRTFGGGNETLGGVEVIIGSEPTPFTGVIREVPQTIIKALKSLICEGKFGNLGVYVFDENGAIGAIRGAEEGTYHPIPIRSFFVGDKTLGGYDAPDSNNIQWSFVSNWSDDLELIKPAFNPLTDL